MKKRFKRGKANHLESLSPVLTGDYFLDLLPKKIQTFS